METNTIIGYWISNMTKDYYKAIIEIFISPYIFFTSYQNYVENTNEELLTDLYILQLF